MKLILKSIATLLLLIGAFSAVGYFLGHTPNSRPSKGDYLSVYSAPNDNTALLQRLSERAKVIKEFSKANRYNTEYCFLMDLQIASGKKRFFIYNLTKNSIESQGLVAHGSGRNARNHGIEFSNDANSLCSSLGKYKIGNSYMGKFGLAFKLYGLDATNSNAFNRSVVLHSLACVPSEETYPFPICESWGCPTVAPLFLKVIKQYIDRAENPILLDIYN